MINDDDKIFEQFKKAADNQDAADFPSQDQVWARLEGRLDRKLLTKENTLWKKIAIAASVLLLFTLGYHLFKPEAQKTIPRNEKVAKDSVQTHMATEILDNQITETDEKNSLIEKDAEKILEKKLHEPIAVATNEILEKDSAGGHVESAVKQTSVADSVSDAVVRYKRGMKRDAFDAISVKHNVRDTKAAFEADKTTAKSVVQKEAPLLVINGKPITTKNSSDQSVKDGLARIDPDELEEIVVLTEPLYVINGHFYSELELFGPNPTSPYAPLNQQEIETLLILQGEKAIKNYGERGAKGVVIITTKNGKPVKAAVPKG